MVLMLRSPPSGRLEARTAALHQLQSIDQSTAPMPSLAAAAGLRLRWLLSLLGVEPLVRDHYGAQQRARRCSAAHFARRPECVLICLAEVAGDDRLDQRGAEGAATLGLGNREHAREEGLVGKVACASGDSALAGDFIDEPV